MKLKFYTLLGILCLFFSVSQAQQTIEFRINGIATNLDDMDGLGAGDSDPQWNYEINDNTFGIDDNDSRELSGTNCAGIRTHVDVFFAQQYDCELPTSFDFIFRGFEDDPVGSDANSGDRTFTFNTSTLNTAGSTTWRNVYGGSGWVEVRANGDACGGTTLNTPILSQGSGNVRYQIRLQYRVLGSTLCHDECNDPYVIPTAVGYQCGATQTSTALNIPINAQEPADASQNSHSMAGISCTYDGGSAEDIWLRTTIPDTTGGVIIQFENRGGCTGVLCQTNITYAWYTSSNGTCSGLEYRGCDAVSCFIGCGNGEIRVDGRAGEDVWVRIWEEDDQGFQLTINQITPISPADRCYTAMPLDRYGCNYGATSPTSGTYAEPDIASWVQNAHPDLNPATCTDCICQDGDSNPATNTVWLSNENLVWYTFTHAGGPFNVAVDNMICSGGASTAQIGVFSNSGSAASPTCNLATETGFGCSVGVGAVQLSIPVLPAGEYILVVDGNAGAQCSWIFRETIGGPGLPLQLLTFKGSFNEATKYTELEWTSADEEDFSGFVVERSLDAINYENIGFVEGMGTAGTEFNYSFFDRNVPMAEVVYYRLRMEDLDGSYRNTNTIAITPKIELAGVSVLYNPYPNPATDKIYIPFNTVKEDKVTAVMYDMSGKLVKTISNQENYQSGYHIIEVNTDDLPGGVYVLRFTAGNITEMKQIVIH